MKTKINFRNFNFREEIYDSGLEKKFQSNSLNGTQVTLLNTIMLGSKSGTMVKTQTKDCSTNMQVGGRTGLFANRHDTVILVTP